MWFDLNRQIEDETSMIMNAFIISIVISDKLKFTFIIKYRDGKMGSIAYYINLFTF